MKPNRYVEQLYVGCQQTCFQIFCASNAKKICYDDMIFLSSLLSEYDDLFICESINKLTSYRVKAKDGTTNKKLNLEMPKIDFKDINSKSTLKNSEKKECVINVIEFLLTIIDSINKEDMNKLDHKFCSVIYSHQFFELKKFLLDNVFKTLLLCYVKSPNLYTGLIIIRLFIFIQPKIENFTSLVVFHFHNVVMDVYRESMCKLQKDEHSYDFHRECLLKESFTVKDFVNLTNSFQILLESFENPSIRNNQDVEKLLDLYSLFYILNEKLNVFPFKKFYLLHFCKNLNFKEEYKHYKLDCKSILNYNFCIPIEIKAEILRYENSDNMKLSLQDAFFRSLFEGPIPPYFFFEVNRDNLYEDTLHLLNNCKSKELQKQLKITFLGEEGVDSGGIRKEFFQLLGEYLINDEDLFVKKENCIWINGLNKNYIKFENFGKILAVSLYNDVIMNLPLPKLFYGKLLDKELHFDDLQEIEPAIYTSLKNLENLDANELEGLELSFDITYTFKLEESININLLKSKNEKVTKSNFNKFKTLYFDYIAISSVRKQFKSIKKGFYQIVTKDIMSVLHQNELEKIIVGSDYLNIQELKKYTILHDYESKHFIIQSFWEIFEEYSVDDQKKLLQFITGNNKLPIGGVENLKMILMKNGCDSNRLPSSQTCFNTLLLPEYSSKEKLKEKLDKAIHMTQGFYLL